MTLLSSIEAARKINVTQACILDLIKEGRLPASRIMWGNRPVWRIEESNLLKVKVSGKGRPSHIPVANPSGICQCGCGGAAPIATHTKVKKNQYKGERCRFIQGHNNNALAPDRYIIDPETGCWNWQRNKTKFGYGIICGRVAHRVLYESKYGKLPAGKELDHLCRNPSCVNLDHLEVVTHTQNVRRSSLAKITPEQADAIRAAYVPHTVGYRKLAEMFGVSTTSAGRIVKSKPGEGD